MHRTAGQPSRSRIGQAGSHSDAANETKDKEAFIVNTLEAILPTIRHVAERGGDVGNVPDKCAILTALWVGAIRGGSGRVWIGGTATAPPQRYTVSTLAGHQPGLALPTCMRKRCAGRSVQEWSCAGKGHADGSFRTGVRLRRGGLRTTRPWALRRARICVGVGCSG
jgi:hypothetical protein